MTNETLFKYYSLSAGKYQLFETTTVAKIANTPNTEEVFLCGSVVTHTTSAWGICGLELGLWGGDWD